MADYLIWLIFIVFVVLAFTILQLKESRYRRLKKDYQMLEAEHSAMQEEWKRNEFKRLQLERSLVGSKRWKDQLKEIRGDLRSAKMAPDYLSAKRLEHLEEYVAGCILAGDPDLVFLGTFKPMVVYTLKERLIRMIDLAEFEIEIISPWIKRQTWECIKVSVARFIKKGGSLRVFIRDEESDFSRRMGDDIREEVEAMGGR
jgi:predicted Holliday junction resolvase-like endonuclease